MANYNQFVPAVALVAAVGIPSCYLGMKIEQCGQNEDKRSYTEHAKEGRVLPSDLHYAPWKNGWPVISGRGKYKGLQCIFQEGDGYKSVRGEAGNSMFKIGTHSRNGDFSNEFRDKNRGRGDRNWTRVRQKKYR